MQNDRGFTLLETLTAFVVLALILGAAYSAMTGGLRAMDRSDDVLSNLSLAESTLAKLGTELSMEPGRRRFEEEDRTIVVTVSPYRPGEETWRIIGETPLQISVEVSGPDGTGSVRLETLRHGVRP